MKKIIIALGLLLTAIALTGNTTFAASTSELLQQGLYAEEVEGNINSAIKAYDQVARNTSAPPNQIAQALYREGMCYLKLKDEASARAVLERLVTDYSSQTEIVQKAKPVLDNLIDFDPAALMPPGTLVYLELGSPGVQIETILNMLKGTPFENPLAAIGGSQSHHGNQKSPADIMGALLNPSMIAEFKKIRSSAIGLTGVANDNPPMVAVLYPGDSDALRGVIVAALGVAGTPGPAMAGMQTIKLPQDTEAAYDNRVMILAHPASQLDWCVKQYKGLISEPTLASSNRSFEKLNKNLRKKNALTVWVNADEFYLQLLKLFPEGHVPEGFQSANRIADFTNIDDLVLTAAVKPDGLACQTDVTFKNGHHCLAYDLIHSPNITKAALNAVPANAIALTSFSLSQEDSNRTDQVREAVRNVTGLDIGREVFANIEQLTVFAMPAAGKSGGGAADAFLPNRLGLAITSHNPVQTRQLLGTLLSTANTMSAGQQNTEEGRYKIGNHGRQTLYCYMKQVKGITFLSLSRDVVDAAVAAVNQHKSVSDSGPLNRLVSRLNPTASKVILVNVGGAIRLLAPQMNVGSLNDEQRQQLNAGIEQLASAADRATIELRTDEQRNEFMMNVGVSGVPPLNQILGPVGQIQGVMQQGRAQAATIKARSSRPATIFPAASEPIIDAQVDDIWNSAQPYQLKHVLHSPKGSTNLPSANYRAMWDKANLFLLIDVVDSTLHHKPDAPWHDNDGIELYLDATNGKSASYSPTDYQYCFNWDKTSPPMCEKKHGKTNGVDYALITTDKGYRVEIKLPWSTLGATPTAGNKIGLDVQVIDNQRNNKRDAKIAWHDQHDDAWHSPQAFGNAELGGLIGWWKFDETQGKTAKDSSGNGHAGTLVGNARWAKGKLGGALDLDGKGSFVRIADKSAFNLGGEITMAAWVNFRSKPIPWAAIISKGDTSWRLSALDTDLKIHASVGRSPGDSLNGLTTVNTDEWHHVTAVYGSGILRLYVDGRLEGNQLRTGSMKKNHFDVLIGDNAAQTSRYFNGLLDDVRVYNYALTKSEVEMLASSQ